MVPADQPYLFFLGSTLVMVGFLMLMLSIRARPGSSIGIILLGPIPIVWGGRNKMIFLVPLLVLAFVFALVFLL